MNQDLELDKTVVSFFPMTKESQQAVFMEHVVHCVGGQRSETEPFGLATSRSNGASSIDLVQKKVVLQSLRKAARIHSQRGSSLTTNL